VSQQSEQQEKSRKGLSKSRLEKLSLLKNNGDQSAREELILAHLYLARAHAWRFEGRGVPVEDLYQEGCYGLIRAVDRYIFNPNTSFAGFALPYINKYIQAALIKQRTGALITLTEDYFYIIRRYFAIYNTLSETLGRIPTTKELSDATGLSESYITKKINSTLYHYTHLEEPIPTPNNIASTPLTQGECISATPDILCPTEDAALANIAIEELLASMTHILTKREQDIIFRRLYSILVDAPVSFSALAKEYGVSECTVTSCYRRGILKIRRYYAKLDSS